MFFSVWTLIGALKSSLQTVIDNDKYILLETNLIKIQLNQSPNAET